MSGLLLWRKPDSFDNVARIFVANLVDMSKPSLHCKQPLNLGYKPPLLVTADDLLEALWND